MQHPEMNEDFLQFESKVNQVMKLLQDFSIGQELKGVTNINDVEKVAKDLTAAVDEESFIVTVRDDRTFINKTKESKEPATGGTVSMDQFTFMKQVEKDAEERAKARRERERVAQNLRAVGNCEFRKNNYEKAILYYTKAIEQIKDSPILYCNRALCYIKLQNFKRAIIDCDFVLNKLDEKNLRAWLYCASAYKRLCDEKNYETCVKFVRKHNIKHSDYIEKYLAKFPTEL